MSGLSNSLGFNTSAAPLGGRVFNPFDIEGRTSIINDEIQKNLKSDVSAISSSSHLTVSAMSSLDDVSLSFLYILVLKIANFVIKLFASDFKKIDDLFVADAKCKSLIRSITQIILPNGKHHLYLPDINIPANTIVDSKNSIDNKLFQKRLYEIQKVHLEVIKNSLNKFKSCMKDDSLSNQALLDEYVKMPESVGEMILNLASLHGIKDLKENLRSRIQLMDTQSSLFDHIDSVLTNYIENYSKLID